MKKVEKVILFLLLFWGCCQTLCLGMTDRSQAEKLSSLEPTKQEVLEKYKKSLSCYESISMKISVDVNSFDIDKNNQRHCHDVNIFPQKIDVIFNRDKSGNRVEWIGRRLLCGLDEKINLSSSRVVKMIAHGNQLISLESNNAIGDDIYSRKTTKTLSSKIMIYDSNQKSHLRTLIGADLYGGKCGELIFKA